MDRIIKSIDTLLEHEIDALNQLKTIKSSIIRAVEYLNDCKGRVIITGLGKSGYAARKMAATFSSVGKASIFMHPTEALHGDIGVIFPEDIAICISKSGETLEVKEVMKMFHYNGIKTISITTGKDSTLDREADVSLLIPVSDEGDPLGIVPTTSVVCTIAIGDALASGLMELREVTHEKFRKNHPGGSLGRRLTEVSSLMHEGDDLPVVTEKSTLREAIVEISTKSLGTALILDSNKQLLGIITDGDVRRAMEKSINDNPLDKPALNYCTKNPKVIPSSTLAEEALFIMEKSKITSLIVENEDQIVGVLHIHDILQSRII